MLVKSRRINKKSVDNVVIAPSSVPDAGHGLIATKHIHEGKYICTYGKRYPHNLAYSSVFDTVFQDRNGMGIGDRNKDYGAWCNDPLDDVRINCNIEYDSKDDMYYLRARWDIAPNEELFVSYGIEYWKNNYWLCPEAVKKCYPSITPNTPAPAEGENSDDYGFVELPAGTPENLPTDIYTTKTRPWCKDQPKKLGIGIKVLRLARVMEQTFALDMLSETRRVDEERACEDDIAERIGKLQRTFETRKVRGKRIIMVTSRQKEQMAQLDAQMRRIRTAKTKKGIKKDNPTLNEAMKREDWPMFKAAIDEELKQIAVGEEAHAKKATTRQDLPKGANVIGSMLVLTVKRLPNGKIDKYKARLVAFGNHQRASSYDQIKAGTVRGSTVKLLVSLQAKTRACSMVLDIKGAYLKTVIKDPEKEKLYIRYPDGRIFKLLKYIYGLKQAGYEWQQNVTGVLRRLGYVQSPFDPMVFSKHTGKRWIIMCLHVDDFFVVASHKHLLTLLYQSLTKEYGSVSINEGDLLSYLGMQLTVNQDNGDITLSQPGYSAQLCDIHLGTQRPTVHTPISMTQTPRDGDDAPYDVTEYLRAVGGINYLAINTRPDLLFALSTVASACASPTMGDWRKVMRIIGYVACTADLGLTFKAGPIELHCAVDASFNTYHDGKCHFGYAFFLCFGDAAFYSVSRRMKVQPLSSTEAEYVAFCEASRDAQYLRNLMESIGFKCNGPIKMFEDNQSCIDMLNGRSRHTASKHINPKFHYGRDLVAQGVVVPVYVRTEEQVADLFTKALGRTVFEPLQSKLLNL